MKISSINLYTNNAVSSNKNNISRILTKPLEMDTVSFSGMPAESSHIIKAKIEAERIQKQGEEIKANAVQYKNEAYQALDETKQQFIEALDYVNIAKKALANKDVSLQLDNGNTLEIASMMIDGKLSPILIKVLDEHNEQKQSIKVSKGIPTHIEEYKDDGTIKFADFRGNAVLISDDISIEESTKIGSTYVFVDGKITTIRKDRGLDVISNSMNDGEAYFYDEKGNLFLSEMDTKMYLTGERTIEDRYSFINGKLYHYFSNFSNTADNLAAWEESYHYDEYKFIGSTKNAKQSVKGKPTTAKEAIYMIDRKFVEAKDVSCSISDYRQAIFKEKN